MSIALSSVGAAGAVAVNEIRRVLSDLVQDELRGAWEDDAVSRELVVEFVVSTFLTVLTWLLTRNPKSHHFRRM